MVEFNIKKSGEGHYYFPKKLREVVTDNAVVVANYYAAIVHPEETDMKDVIASVRIIIAELEYRMDKKKEVKEA